ncbi:MAG: hypothetical protein JWR72_805 [Flavisolibacter sp.]|nr:hypothetical protein [Flavisolibacter sp.]
MIFKHQNIALCCYEPVVACVDLQAFITLPFLQIDVWLNQDRL